MEVAAQKNIMCSHFWRTAGAFVHLLTFVKMFHEITICTLSLCLIVCLCALLWKLWWIICGHVSWVDCCAGSL